MFKSVKLIARRSSASTSRDSELEALSINGCGIFREGVSLGIAQVPCPDAPPQQPRGDITPSELLNILCPEARRSVAIVNTSRGVLRGTDLINLGVVRHFYFD